MATNRFRFPDGAVLHLATAFAAAVSFTAISNAAPPEVTAAAHGLADGDLVLVRSGWTRLDGRGARVAGSAAGTLDLEGFNTTSALRFPAGQGAGQLRTPTAWQWVDKILEVATSGGEPQFWTGAFLEDEDDTQVPTTRSPQSMTLTLGDDPGSERDEALNDADVTKEPQLLRLTLPNGDLILYTGYVSYNDSPQMTRANPMSTRLTLSLAARPVRYKALP